MKLSFAWILILEDFSFRMRHKAVKISGPLFRKTESWKVFNKGGDLEEISPIIFSPEYLEYFFSGILHPDALVIDY